MDLSLIFTVPGKPGLYKLISQGKNSSIMESLVDHKRTPIFALDRVSSLAEIAIYTYNEEVSLANVFRNIYKKENGAKSISHNENPETIREYFAQVLPEYDKERVYDSNIRKVLQWYNILKDNDLVDLELSEREKAQARELAEHEAEEAAAPTGAVAAEAVSEKTKSEKTPEAGESGSAAKKAAAAAKPKSAKPKAAAKTETEKPAKTAAKKPASKAKKEE